MSGNNVVGRRRLLVLGAAAGVIPACGGSDNPLGGPYGGTASDLPGPTGGSDGGAMLGNGSGSSGSGSGGTSGGGSGGSSGSSGGSSSGSSSGGSSGGSSSGGSSGSSSGGLACTTTGNVYAATFAAHPGLMTVGSGVTVSPPGYQDSWGNDAIYVVQESAGQYIAYSLSCQHQGCQVNKSGANWSCPCHGAIFNATGAHIGGHSSAALKSYSVCADSTAVYVTLG